MAASYLSLGSESLKNPLLFANSSPSTYLIKRRTSVTVVVFSPGVFFFPPISLGPTMTEPSFDSIDFTSKSPNIPDTPSTVTLSPTLIPFLYISDNRSSLASNVWALNINGFNSFFFFDFCFAFGSDRRLWSEIGATFNSIFALFPFLL